MLLSSIILKVKQKKQPNELPHKKSTGKGNVASKINLLEKEG